MKLDRIVKVSLVLIAFFLGIIALRPYIEPVQAHASPLQDLRNMQVTPFFLDGSISALMYDPADGSIWYCYNSSRSPGTWSQKYLGKLAPPVKPAK
jgi:hypothetical protein